MAEERPPLPPGAFTPGTTPVPGADGQYAPGAPPAFAGQTVPVARPEGKAADVSRTPEEPKDSVREVIETVVFVVVLVLLLKTFLAEAFVIPTGSMATTLLGYHRNVTCEQCGYRFP